jgi:zinc transport system permease protein
VRSALQLALALPWPFDRTYMVRALAAGLVVGVSAPLIGAFLVQKRMSLIGDGIGHIAFAGVAGGLLLGVAPVWVALVVAVIGALGVERLRARGTASGDLALALFFYSGIAAGVVLAGKAGALNSGLFTYLFGSPLTATTSDVLLIVGLGLAIVVTIALIGRALFASVIDEGWARVAGLPVGALNAILAVLTAVTVVAAMKVVGVLLVAALLVLPVASGQILGRSFRGVLKWSMAVGAGSVVAGLVAARVWGLQTGATIVLVAALVFALVAGIARTRRGRMPGVVHDVSGHAEPHDHPHPQGGHRHG